MKVSYKGFLNGNVLKIAAAVFMVLDHVGFVFSDKMSYELYVILRSAGRIAMPIFAFLIAESCRYTRDRKKYFLSLFLLGFVCNAVYYIAMNSVYFCILTTFSLSTLLIYSYDELVAAVKNKTGGVLFGVIKFASVICLSLLLIKYAQDKKGTFDYELPGILLPFFCYVFKNRILQLAAFTLGVALSAFTSPFTATSFPSYLFAFAAVPIVALYNGERGKLNLKNFFYLFYPIHLLLLQGLYILLYQL